MVCAGKNVAMTEMRAIVCALVLEFDFEVTEKKYLYTWEDNLFEQFTTKRGSLPVHINTHV